MLTRSVPHRLTVVLGCALGMLTVHAGAARAHAVVTKTSIRHGTVSAGAPADVTLEFNTAIEAKLSKVTLADDKGSERTLEQATGAHPANVLVVSLPSLAAGHYALKYRVLAADGHVTESVIRFEATTPK